MLHRSLGHSGLDVSVIALGSWQTYERIPREQGAAVLNEARAAGIDFLEVARYNDMTGTAPIPTGYSEVVFGEVFRASDYGRDEVTIAGKLWWEFWPEQDAAQELDASLERTGLDHLDFIYSDPPPAELPLEEVVAQIGALLAAGRARAWGIVNWQADRLAEAGRIARAQGVPTPCAAQLPYSLVSRDWVEGQAMVDALQACEASVVASYTLAGGILTGKYADGAAQGRMAGELGDERWRPARAAAQALRERAAELGATPAQLALAFALSNPDTATVLCGATRPEQVADNAAAADLLARLDTHQIARLRGIGA
ncbi:aldo/keto reductase [Capillimicrobium parvum]|uniref:L-glyceraldehyde 3-phosphate reductase n=1 Tax=Capillimicrobium parvum TaxID=2884022 RepID=A0A9E6XZZ9_9ACTN|nr:aldo/keto reductase [Capillimicrobium parvum]UGS37117.1 L-glyceraldehyde 3-phosphate reductase [Capillimicrobium parvum]